LKQRVIYDIFRPANAGKLTKDQQRHKPSKTVMNQAFIAAVSTANAADVSVYIQDLADANGVSFRTIYIILRRDLGLSKRSA